ncbi:hypothetical protein EDC94DRAFT_661121 [Helicostylum pulchrum]|nr:hypothetical protein EDC94DRAFT_661121 [Helicostylum pulchrum]
MDRSTENILSSLQNILNQAKELVAIAEAVVHPAESCRNRAERILLLCQDLVDSTKADNIAISFLEIPRDDTTSTKEYILSGDEKSNLDLDAFSQGEIDKYFRPCTIDPGRNHVFTSFHGNNEIRRMFTKEYYSYGGTLQCLKFQQEMKRRAGINIIESNIPTTKTTSLVKYREHTKNDI